MARPVETATDYKHTHKDLGLIMVTVQTGERKQTDGQTDATKRIISPASRSIMTLTKIFKDKFGGMSCTLESTLLLDH